MGLGANSIPLQLDARFAGAAAVVATLVRQDVVQDLVPQYTDAPKPRAMGCCNIGPKNSASSCAEFEHGTGHQRPCRMATLSVSQFSKPAAPRVHSSHSAHAPGAAGRIGGGDISIMFCFPPARRCAKGLRCPQPLAKHRGAVPWGRALRRRQGHVVVCKSARASTGPPHQPGAGCQQRGIWPAAKSPLALIGKIAAIRCDAELYIQPQFPIARVVTAGPPCTGPWPARRAPAHGSRAASQRPRRKPRR